MEFGLERDILRVRAFLGSERGSSSELRKIQSLRDWASNVGLFPDTLSMAALSL
jgi:hypothetical protein